MDYKNKMNREIQNIKPSGIRKFFDIANELQDVISLSVGEPDFLTPEHIRNVGIKALQEGKTKYSPNRGFIDLRKDVADFYERRHNLSYDAKREVLITVGGSEAIDLCLRVLIGRGDEVLIPEPSFVCYVPITQMVGGVPVTIPTSAENNFKLTAKDIEKHITPKTKVIILPYPSNPTGAVLRRNELCEIAKVIEKYDLMVLADEIYGELTYGDEEHVSIAEIDGMKERTVIVNGFSKTYSMTGWRMGYTLGPDEIITQMTKLHQFAIMSAPTVSQYAAMEALRNGDEDIEYMKKEYRKRSRLLVDELNRMGLTCTEPEGAFYVFPSIKSTGLKSEEFCERLIYSEGVAVVPGTAFGECGEGHVRISYSYSVDHIKEALKRMEKFINSLK